MGNLRMPGVSGFNPPMWDKVIDTPSVTVAIALTASGKARMYEMGWLDAIDGKPIRFHNEWYMNGHEQGLNDLELEKNGK